MSSEATLKTTEFPTQYRVRIADSLGVRHLVLGYGSTEGKASRNALERARILLQDPKCRILGIKNVKLNK